MASDYDGILEPADGQVFLGCRPYDPSMDATSGGQRPDGSWTFRRRARKVKNCICGAGKLGFVQPGTALVCEPCSRSGQDHKLPRVVAPPAHDAPAAPRKPPEGGLKAKVQTRREKRLAKYGKPS